MCKIIYFKSFLLSGEKYYIGDTHTNYVALKKKGYTKLGRRTIRF